MAVGKSCDHFNVQSRAAWVRATKESSKEPPRPSASSHDPACPTQSPFCSTHRAHTLPGRPAALPPRPSLPLALGAPQGLHPAWCSDKAGLRVNPGLRLTLSSEKLLSPEPTEFLQLVFVGRRGALRVFGALYFRSVLTVTSYLTLLCTPPQTHTPHTFLSMRLHNYMHRNPTCAHTHHTHFPTCSHKCTHTDTTHHTTHTPHSIHITHPYPDKPTVSCSLSCVVLSEKSLCCDWVALAPSAQPPRHP